MSRRPPTVARLAGTLLAAALLAAGGCSGPGDPLGEPDQGAAPPAGASSAAASDALPTGPPGDQPTGPGGAAGDAHGDWDVTQMPDPCRLVTRAQVAAAVAAPVDAGSRLQSWPPLCSFRMPGPPEEFLYVSDDSRPAAREDFDRQRSDSATPQTVSGVGDLAYWLPDYTALHVYSGRTHVTVKFAGDDPPPKAKDKAVVLARIALPRAKADA